MSDELFVGDVVLHDQEHTAHVTLMLGSRTGVFKDTFAETMAGQRPEYIAFMVCARPNVPVRPLTVYVNKNPYASEEHGALHWGPGHLGVAAGMLDGVRDGIMSPSQAHDLLCISVVWIWETARDVDRVFVQTRKATRSALEQAMTGNLDAPAVEEIAQKDGLDNPYYSVLPGDVS